MASNVFIWSDKGSGAKDYASVWPIVPKDKSGFKVGCVYVSPKSHKEKPNPCYPTAYVLKI
jgi:hypothetical protein